MSTIIAMNQIPKYRLCDEQLIEQFYCVYYIEWKEKWKC